jgi:uncharacterized protein with GYD domain
MLEMRARVPLICDLAAVTIAVCSPIWPHIKLELDDLAGREGRMLYSAEPVVGALAEQLAKEGVRMETYISFMKLTEQGIKNIKDFPQRLEAGTKGIEAMGGKITGFYAVMGEYDYVAITEVPNAEAGMAFLLTLGALGNTRTVTQRAFPANEFANIVKKIS